MSNLISRGQLITTFGTGNIYTFPSGDAGICSGLDHWFTNAVHEEFGIREPRIPQLLGIPKLKLRSPPDWRVPRPNGGNNQSLSIPFIRFPQWHVCSACGRMRKVTLNQGAGVLTCEQDCGKPNLPQAVRRFRQVRFVAMCANGHVHDFPWMEWVHRGNNPCNSPRLKLTQRGTAGLEGLNVECQGCNRQRSLAGITSIADFEKGTTVLSNSLLDGDDVFLCRGISPWLGEPYPDNAPSNCDAHIVASLRNASNLYFPKVVTALHVPALEGNLPGELLVAMRSSAVIPNYVILMPNGEPTAQWVELVRQQLDGEVPGGNVWSSEQIGAAMEKMKNARQVESTFGQNGDDREPEFLRAEWTALQLSLNRPNFQVDYFADLDGWALNVLEGRLGDWLDGIGLVKRLRETRCLAGFSRVNPDESSRVREKIGRMWRNVPSDDNLWLPAVEVYGEGLFFKVSEARLCAWERGLPALAPHRLQQLHTSIERNKTTNPEESRFLGPRFVMIHTLAHLLINRLVYECGYGSASLRERIYVSSGDNPMAGFLIYTASGDSEGSMGGLVRMGEPGRLEPLFHRALEGAQWCSNDPICMELADHGGQGTDSANLAACHSCTLLPETSCTEFNKFLDRGFVVGLPDKPGLGFFRVK